MAGKPFRLTRTSYAVLGLVDYLGSATPYDLKRSMEQTVENFWPMPHTTSYAEPVRLAGAGYLSERREEGGRRRKLYTVTEKGAQALREWLAGDRAAAPQVRDEAMLKIFLGASPAPLISQRVEWHRRKVGELQTYLEKVRSAGGPPGVELSLVAGIEYHRRLIEMLEGLVRGV